MNGSQDVSRAADMIRGGFEELRNSFGAITRRAVHRFESRDWEGIHRDTVRRLVLHKRLVDETLVDLTSTFGEQANQREFWQALKNAYSEAILGSSDFELAQSFFNSLTRRVFSHSGVDGAIDYLAGDFPLPFAGWEMSSARMYASKAVTPALLRRILLDARFHAPFEDIEQASMKAALSIERSIREQLGSDVRYDAVDMLTRPFVRNKAAYLVGRLRRGDETLIPIVLAILNPDGRLIVDATVTTEAGVSIIFSFARWYFHVDVESPREVIGFLRAILPRKRIPELYISLGHHKHGKTAFFGDLVHQLANTPERFILAPGQPGMVMSVFTLPSYEFVFKVIRDRFPASKNTTAERVRQRYRQVLLRDRVGRLVDYQEFEHLEFSRDLFEDDVLNELLETAGKTVDLRSDRVHVKHLYIGRRVTPLDLYLRRVSTQSRIDAVIDWGNAIKDLAAANIFAGDMLPKNFGVTRHGRVVFYDYDELSLLEECRFRSIPPPRHPEDEMASEPWFSVSEGDVFPEEFLRFLGLDPELKSIFLEHHSDLLTPDYWTSTQERTASGELIDVLPYKR